MSTQKPLLEKKSPFGARSQLRDWVLEYPQTGSTTELFQHSVSCFTDCNQGTPFLVYFTWKSPAACEAPLMLFWATQAQVPDRNEPRYKHWSHLQRAKWSLKYNVSFIPIVLQKRKFVFLLYARCIHIIPTQYYRTVRQIIAWTEPWHKSLSYYLEQPNYFVFWRK